MTAMIKEFVGPIESYLAVEERATSWITTQFWKPRTTGGSSKAKAILIIRSYFRVFLVTFFLSVMTAVGSKLRSIERDKINYSNKPKIILIRQKHYCITNPSLDTPNCTGGSRDMHFDILQDRFRTESRLCLNSDCLQLTIIFIEQTNIV